MSNFTFEGTVNTEGKSYRKAIKAAGHREAMDALRDMFHERHGRHAWSRELTLRYVPKVGDGAHYGGNGDAYPCTIVAMSKSGHRVTVRDDRARVLPGKGGQYEGPKPALFEVDPNGAERVFTRRKDGTYREKGCNWATLGAGRQTAYNPHL